MVATAVVPSTFCNSSRDRIQRHVTTQLRQVLFLLDQDTLETAQEDCCSGMSEIAT
jgi:hypothetical protein